MRFSARVKIDEETNVATPTLLVEAEAPEAGMDEKQLSMFMKNVVPGEVHTALMLLPKREAGERSNTDVWIVERPDGTEQVLHCRAEFGDGYSSHGFEKTPYLAARIIETLQVPDNWSRKPHGKWMFAREFSLEAAPEIKPITKDEIEKIVCEGVNGMYKAIQDKIGVTTGDIAGLYHSGSKIEEQITEFFVEYVRFEKRNS